MPDDAMASPLDLGDDLRRYFAITTATELPRRVREMSAATLRPRRRSYGPLLGGGGAGLAVAAVVALVVVGLHHGATGGAGSMAASSGAALANPRVSVAYPGVDASRLARAGVVLQPPSGHGTARLTPAEAQAAAVAASADAGGPGPAVLAWAQLGAGTPASTCLCWVVEVHLGDGTVNSPAGPAPTPPIHNVLVLVDATTGRIADTVAVPGP
jgi:hypothetical protein